MNLQDTSAPTKKKFSWLADNSIWDCVIYFSVEKSVEEGNYKNKIDKEKI